MVSIVINITEYFTESTDHRRFLEHDGRLSAIESAANSIIRKRSFLTQRSPLREKCSNTEFFLVRISRTWTEYRGLLHKSPYSVQLWENTDQKKTPYLDNFCAVDSEACLRHYQRSKMDLFVKTVSDWKSLTYFCKKFHLRYLKGFWASLFLMELDKEWFDPFMILFKEQFYWQQF